MSETLSLELVQAIMNEFSDEQQKKIQAALDNGNIFFVSHFLRSFIHVETNELLTSGALIQYIENGLAKTLCERLKKLQRVEALLKHIEKRDSISTSSRNFRVEIISSSR